MKKIEKKMGTIERETTGERFICKTIATLKQDQYGKSPVHQTAHVYFESLISKHQFCVNIPYEMIKKMAKFIDEK